MSNAGGTQHSGGTKAAGGTNSIGGTSVAANVWRQCTRHWRKDWNWWCEWLWHLLRRGARMLQWDLRQSDKRHQQLRDLRRGLYRDEPFLQQRRLRRTALHGRYLRGRSILLWTWLLHSRTAVLLRAGAGGCWTTMRDASWWHLPARLPTMRLRLPRHTHRNPSRGSSYHLIA
jgi:hypothetical protein